MAGDKAVAKTGKAGAAGKGKKTGGRTPYVEQIVVPRLHSKKVRNPRKLTHRPPKTRKSLVGGTVLILLNGPYKGKRVVFLKQLPSGMLLVTGPLKVNGVPLRRASPRSVIVTSTKLDISGVISSAELKNVKDDQFMIPAAKKAEIKKFRVEASKNNDTTFYNDKFKRQEVPAEFKQLQDKIDASILATTTKDPILTQYLRTKFSLRNADRPHMMKF